MLLKVHRSWNDDVLSNTVKVNARSNYSFHYMRVTQQGLTTLSTLINPCMGSTLLYLVVEYVILVEMFFLLKNKCSSQVLQTSAIISVK